MHLLDRRCAARPARRQASLRRRDGRVRAGRGDRHGGGHGQNGPHLAPQPRRLEARLGGAPEAATDHGPVGGLGRHDHPDTRDGRLNDLLLRVAHDHGGRYGRHGHGERLGLH